MKELLVPALLAAALGCKRPPAPPLPPLPIACGTLVTSWPQYQTPLRPAEGQSLQRVRLEAWVQAAELTPEHSATLVTFRCDAQPGMPPVGTLRFARDHGPAADFQSGMRLVVEARVFTFMSQKGVMLLDAQLLPDNTLVPH